MSRFSSNIITKAINQFTLFLSSNFFSTFAISLTPVEYVCIRTYAFLYLKSHDIKQSHVNTHNLTQIQNIYDVCVNYKSTCILWNHLNTVSFVIWIFIGDNNKFKSFFVILLQITRHESCFILYKAIQFYLHYCARKRIQIQLIHCAIVIKFYI